MTIYTNINKPSNTSYTNLNTIGKQQYDQADITYDSSTIFYDGINPNEWTDITSPSATSWTPIAKPV